MIKRDEIVEIRNTKDIVKDACNIIETTQKEAYSAVNKMLITRNWLLGKRIGDEELIHGGSTSYGKEIIKNLSKSLSNIYGKGFTERILYYCEQFYRTFPDILNSLSSKSAHILSWTHYRVLLQVNDEAARNWYIEESYANNWSIRTLQRNIYSQYYYRVLKNQVDKNNIIVDNTIDEKDDKLEFIKNPMVVEFLGLTIDPSFNETKLESSIISNLQRFLMEMGKGYAFVARQQHIHTEKEDYYIDLVFYNYILKCFVLIDLKTKKITHQDVGQMDMYIRMYDEMKRNDGDNPTIGIVLCSETDEDIAKYSVLHGNEQLFASKYKLYLPTEEELRKEIETQKAIFNSQNL